MADEPAQLVRETAAWLEREMAKAIADRGSCAVCLSGGKTPEPVYRALAAGSSVEWGRVDVFFGDERAVPPDHPQSNYRMVYSALLSRVPVPARQIHRMEAERPDRDASAREYERALPATARRPPSRHGLGWAHGIAVSRVGRAGRAVSPGGAGGRGRRRRPSGLTITAPGDRSRAQGSRDGGRRGQGGPGRAAPTRAHLTEGVPVQLARRGLLVSRSGRRRTAAGAAGAGVIVLAGDVGGTNARLGLVELNGQAARIATERTLSVSRDYPGLSPIVRRFCEETSSRPERACIAIACPIVDGDCIAPNLPWTVNALQLAADIGIPDTAIINDFVAVGYGIALLGPAGLATLQQGETTSHGTIALLGAGTGLGQGFLVWDRDHYQILPSEGGHADFAARGEVEAGLLRFLEQKFHRVSWERLLSGAGIVNIYAICCPRGCRRSRPRSGRKCSGKIPPRSFPGTA